jgi:hypothetical protein
MPRFWLGLFVCAQVLYASTADAALPFDAVDLSGDTVEYASPASIMASENVVVSANPLIIHASELAIDFDNQRVQFPQDMTLIHPQGKLFGRAVSANYHQGIGSAKEVFLHIAPYFIRGATLTFSPYSAVISSASVTTCDRDPPDYIIKAKEVIFYPSLGMLVSLNDYLFVNNVPIFYFPSYIIGSRSYSLLGRYSPLPEVGSNAVEGLYIRSQLGYFLNEGSFGYGELGLTQRYGWLIGVNHFWEMSGNDNVNLHLGFLSGDGFRGGLSYTRDLVSPPTSEIQANPLDIFKLFSPRSLPYSRLHVQYTHRELVSDYWVSLAPHVGLEFPGFSWYDWQYRANLNVANVIQVDPSATALPSVELFRYHADMTTERTYPLHPSLNMQLKGTYSGYWYNTVRPWQRLLGDIAFATQFGPFTPKLTYTKLVANQGQNPFQYDAIETIDSDELGIHLRLDMGTMQWVTNSSYNLWSNRFRRMENQLIFSFHCWYLTTSWESVQKIFRLGVSLEASR